MGQWTEVTAAEVRELPDGTRARLYSTDVRGYTQWLDGFVWHKSKYSAEFHNATLAPMAVRAYKGKAWKILKEE